MKYTIAEVSKRVGISIYTLRYYDKEGLLPFVGRTASGIRSFKESDFEWLMIISCLKKTGMSIKKIKAYIDLCMQGNPSLTERLDIFFEQKKVLEEKMTELQECMNTINYKITYYKTALAADDTSKSEKVTA